MKINENNVYVVDISGRIANNNQVQLQLSLTLGEQFLRVLGDMIT